MSITSVMAVVTVANFDGARAWYERLFGRTADRRPMDGLAEWHLTDTGALQVVHDQDRGGSALLTLGVDDLDRIVSELSERGLVVGEIIAGVVARIASIADPEGNTITFAQLYASGAGPR